AKMWVRIRCDRLATAHSVEEGTGRRVAVYSEPNGGRALVGVKGETIGAEPRDAGGDAIELQAEVANGTPITGLVERPDSEVPNPIGDVAHVCARGRGGLRWWNKA